MRPRPGYPPYNIERTGDNAYRVSVAVAGFGEDDLNIELKENTLTIKGEKQEQVPRSPARCSIRVSPHAHSSAYSSLPISSRLGARKLENGLLHVDLVREIPGDQEAAPDPDQQQGGGRKTIEAQVETKVAVTAFVR